eukprot:CAMPEP_0202920178 /NCGR_PEP_ID=MMETSP1392-20130828/76723_1 /ASSEMBLY_ACC=CAM_ASM_000868 /TAXON_ID=225041 /ORGANISM="Chlamydomonas chlamydogama, Strain SAG 11-48b" /LENGTH=166 /DNA_ID=CAMNT_0049613663 /DNA_START=844 /DNA_END=1343 /DNA_ORIENTATION=-
MQTYTATSKHMGAWEQSKVLDDRMCTSHTLVLLCTAWRAHVAVHGPGAADVRSLLGAGGGNAAKTYSLYSCMLCTAMYYTALYCTAQCSRWGNAAKTYSLYSCMLCTAMYYTALYCTAQCSRWGNAAKTYSLYSCMDSITSTTVEVHMRNQSAASPSYFGVTALAT